jgi:hypothetical protein
MARTTGYSIWMMTRGPLYTAPAGCNLYLGCVATFWVAGSMPANVGRWPTALHAERPRWLLSDRLVVS